ncbi:MAG: SpoIIE family protein phosphatase [Selenomonadaceae bacterium]|nr:SpoIIE family protein phosphatase [Selenomonadaceae bacterium]
MNFKFNIHKKVRMLVLLAGLLSFLVLGAIALYGLASIRADVSEMGTEFGESGANYTQNLLTKQLTETLGALVESRAEYINRDMERMMQDVIILAETMTEIASHPQNYEPRTLPDPRYERIGKAETYIIYSPALREQGVSPALSHEIEIASNIRDYLVPLAKSYHTYKSSFYVGSKNGYFLCSGILPGVDYSPIIEEEIYNYDPRQRPWYQTARDANKPLFSDLYADIDVDKHGIPYQVVGCSAPYYDADGFAGVVGLDISNTDMNNAVLQTGIGERGFSFVLNDKGRVIISAQKEGLLASKEDGPDLRHDKNTALADTVKSMVAGESGVNLVKIDGENYYIAFAPMPSIGWSFATLIREEEILNSAEQSRTYFADQINTFQDKLSNEYTIMFSTAVLVLAVLLSGLIYFSNKLSARFVKPILQLSDGVRDIAGGNLDKKITDINTGDEIEHLAVCFNAMTDELQNYMNNLKKVTADKERIATELNVARDIQRGMLPGVFPAYPDRKEFDIYATMDAAKEVGGDFYDFYLLDEDHLVVTIADVSGKGIPASLFMVISKTILKNFSVFLNDTKDVNREEDFSEVMTRANDQLCEGNEEMMFVTVFLGMLDLKTGRFVYVNGGHNPPIIYHHAERRCEYLGVKKNFVLGGMEDMRFVQQEIQLLHGDLIFMYTDGVNEAMNENKEEYTSERLLRFMNQTNCDIELKELLKAIKADVAEHVGEAEQSDDMTMMALRRN